MKTDNNDVKIIAIIIKLMSHLVKLAPSMIAFYVFLKVPFPYKESAFPLWVFATIVGLVHIVRDLRKQYSSKQCGYGTETSISQVCQEGESKHVSKTDSIIGLMIETKTTKEQTGYHVLAMTCLASVFLTSCGIMKINMVFMSFLLVFTLMLSVNHMILEYRIKKNYYGTTQYEVREIIQFIEEHSDKTDFVDKDGRKKLFPETEQESTINDYVVGGLVNE